jgi:hypothetical protein
MKCPRCNVEMEIGIAIDAPDPNVRIFAGSLAITDVHKSLIDVYKCLKCGHSDDGYDPTKLIGIIDNR